jgi:hypothetical protein
VYGDINRVDLQVGMMAEKPPPGFGFSETAFRIFLLMAYRRLKSDRFFTTDYSSEMYTTEGMDWINAAGMRSVLLRHYPELTGALRQVQNPFAPWQRIGGAEEPGDICRDPNRRAAADRDTEPPGYFTGKVVERARSSRTRSTHGAPARHRR